MNSKLCVCVLFCIFVFVCLFPRRSDLKVRSGESVAGGGLEAPGKKSKKTKKTKKHKKHNLEFTKHCVLQCFFVFGGQKTKNP